MLNEAQRQAVHASGHCLITAPPGSGKTRVLQERVAVILRRHRDARVCAVAFTKASALELDERIRRQSPDAGPRVLCGTFHSICKRMLEQSGRRFHLVAEGQLDLMRRAYLDALQGDDSLPFEDACNFIARTKCAVDPLLASASQDARVAVYERYQGLLQSMGALDLADLLVECVRGIQSGAVATLDVTHLLIDEFQDSDEVQLQWALEHARHGIEVTVVGDDDQSIYGWRGGMGTSGMVEFRTTTKARHIPLTLSYRCPREIMVPSARLIVRNQERVQKLLDTACTQQGFVHVRRFPTPLDEVDELLRSIILSGNPSAWGVLARTNLQLDAVERGLEAAQLPYIRLGGESFWTRPVPALFLGVCQSLANLDMIGIGQLLIRSGVAELTVQQLQREVIATSPGALRRFTQGGVKKGGIGEIETVRKLVRQWRDLLDSGDDETALSGVAAYLEKHGRLSDASAGPDRKAKDRKMLKHCVEALSRTHATSDGRVMSKKSTASLKTRLMLATKKRDDLEEDKESVRLMTLHSSKGLEFEKVWIVGCQEGVIPNQQSPLEEERRLFYVGMTRTKEDLTLSYVIDERAPVSRFIAEAGLG